MRRLLRRLSYPFGLAANDITACPANINQKREMISTFSDTSFYAQYRAKCVYCYCSNMKRFLVFVFFHLEPIAGLSHFRIYDFIVWICAMLSCTKSTNRPSHNQCGAKKIIWEHQSSIVCSQRFSVLVTELFHFPSTPFSPTHQRGWLTAVFTHLILRGEVHFAIKS